MYRLLLVIFAMMLATAAYAQDADPAPEGSSDEPAPLTFKAFDADSHGFSIDLPTTGTINSPADDDWEMEEQVAFEWYGSDDQKVALIQGRIDDLGSDLDDDMFGLFCTALLENWSEEPDNYTVLTSNKALVFGGRNWNLVEVEDRTDETVTVYYSVFSTYEGPSILTVSFYYLEPVSEEIELVGVPVLKSVRFK